MNPARGAPLLLVLALVAACGGSSGGGAAVTISAASGGSVVSDDGLLTLEVPPGALADDTKISIEAVDPDELPSGEDVETELDVEAAYRLEPNGLTFHEPVTVTLRLDSDEFALTTEEGAFQVPLLFVRSESEEPEPLADLDFTLSPDEGEASVGGKLQHFSRVERVKGPYWVALEQPDESKPLGLPFQVELAYQGYAYSPAGIFDFTYFETAPTYPSGEYVGSDEVAVISVNGRPGTSFTTDLFHTGVSAELVCVQEGTGFYSANFEDSFYRRIKQRDAEDILEPVTIRVTVDAEVDCVAALGDTPTPTPTKTPPSGLFVATPTPPGIALETPTPPPSTPAPGATEPPAATATPEQVGCRVRAETTLLGTVDGAEGTRTNVEVALTEEDGSPALDHSVGVQLDKAGAVSQAEGNTGDVGALTFSVLHVDPGTYSLQVVEVRDPDGEPCSPLPGTTAFATWTAESAGPAGDVFIDCEHGESSSRITVTGTGFPPDGVLEVDVSGPGVVGADSFVLEVGSNGAFSFPVDIEIRGDYTIEIDGVTYFADCN